MAESLPADQLDPNAAQIPAIDAAPVVLEDPLAAVNWQKIEPVPELEAAVAVADNMRKKKIIGDRKDRTAALLEGRSIEIPKSAPADLPVHLCRPCAKGMR